MTTHHDSVLSADEHEEGSVMEKYLIKLWALHSHFPFLSNDFISESITTREMCDKTPQD